MTFLQQQQKFNSKTLYFSTKKILPTTSRYPDLWIIGSVLIWHIYQPLSVSWTLLKTQFEEKNHVIFSSKEIISQNSHMYYRHTSISYRLQLLVGLVKALNIQHIKVLPEEKNGKTSTIFFIIRCSKTHTHTHTQGRRSSRSCVTLRSDVTCLTSRLLVRKISPFCFNSALRYLTILTFSFSNGY